MHILEHTPANDLSLDETLAKLASQPTVDGVALFGSKAGPNASPISDHDLLILVTELPIPIFQMFTHIEKRMADVVFLETTLVDHLFQANEPVAANSFEGMQLLKMAKLQIMYDETQRLSRLQQLALDRAATNNLLLPTSDNQQYQTWFWLNFGLAHIKRMAQSDDPVYETAVDMMLATSLGGMSRAYCSIRHIPWEGEKAALRYLAAHDSDYLALLRSCLRATERHHQLVSYEQLVQQTLAPIGELWQTDVTAVYLRGAEHTAENLDTALNFWNNLLTPMSQ